MSWMDRDESRNYWISWHGRVLGDNTIAHARRGILHPSGSVEHNGDFLLHSHIPVGCLKSNDQVQSIWCTSHHILWVRESAGQVTIETICGFPGPCSEKRHGVKCPQSPVFGVLYGHWHPDGLHPHFTIRPGASQVIHVHIFQVSQQHHPDPGVVIMEAHLHAEVSGTEWHRLYVQTIVKEHCPGLPVDHCIIWPDDLVIHFLVQCSSHRCRRTMVQCPYSLGHSNIYLCVCVHIYIYMHCYISFISNEYIIHRQIQYTIYILLCITDIYISRNEHMYFEPFSCGATNMFMLNHSVWHPVGSSVRNSCMYICIATLDPVKFLSPSPSQWSSSWQFSRSCQQPSLN